ncbi:hypothetical protein HK097_002792 [Rhizophlyctis rosea]|uniref:Glycoside hydrolase family 43 n=1 Tax=Rhizophlyctis rosea TaxID=64517 RepID=A0AAD5S344_9FUNG|nr:hypothetical protein HK097_002792 [Rhizophlyctis rosea]
MRAAIIPLLALLAVLCGTADAVRNIWPGTPWKDVNGNALHAHGGQILTVNGQYYWVGETDKASSSNRGVNLYSSPDLLAWTFRGTLVTASQIKQSTGNSGVTVVERPKIVFNRNTNKYVLYIHLDNSDYSYASVGVYTASSVTGPYQFVRSIRPNGLESRDLGVFIDDDQTPYLLYASGHVNTHVTISRLTSDGTNSAGIVSQIQGGLESPTILKGNGGYYLILSTTTGWSPNAGKHYWASSLSGPWWDNGALSTTSNTHNSQPTYLLPLQGRSGTKYLYMGDRWSHPNLASASYVWLPVKLGAKGTNPGVQIQWKGDKWDLDAYLNE